MKALTEADVGPIADATLAGVPGVAAEWDRYPHPHKDGAHRAVMTFANALLAKYGTQPDERAIIERERKAWDAACSYCLSGNSMQSSATDAQRDRRYPLPAPEPTPVLTDEEIQEATGHTLTFGDLMGVARNIERAVQRKLAQQKP